MSSNWDRQALESLSFIRDLTSVLNIPSVNGTLMTRMGRIHADLFRLLSAMIRCIRVVSVPFARTPNGKWRIAEVKPS
jgi:hypothetical protein